MKNLLFLSVLIFALISCDPNELNDEPTIYNDSISMGAGYANDVFYSLEDGVVKTIPGNNWDIAFSTNPMTSTVMINEGHGVELYTYPNGDAASWNEVDTNGYKAWPLMYNSDTTWFNGAFDRNETGHPDYGWGVYNSQTHDVVGDSIFLIRTTEGKLLKLMIEKRAAATNSFIIRYAGIGEADKSSEIACGDYSDRNFIYFSLTSEEVMDNEPEKDSWDLVFTRYYDESISYIVSGVLSNESLEVAEVRDIDPSEATLDGATFTTGISTIGYDWKTFDNVSFTYVIEPDVSYFVNKGSLNLFQLVFNGTDGRASGKISFSVEKIQCQTCL